MNAPLAGIIAVEYGPGAAVAYAGKLFAEMGATVVKIEPPGGDALRTHISTDLAGVTTHTNWFAALNAGKQSLVVEDANSAQAAALWNLLERSAVLFHAAGNDGAFSAARLSDEFPDLVVIELALFGRVQGQRGMPADDLTVQAMSGISLGIGEPEGVPLKLPGEQSGYQAGLCAAVAASAQLCAGGALIDLAAADVWASFYNGGEIANDYFGRKRRPRVGAKASRQPYVKGVFRCKDGYFAIQCIESRQWMVFLGMLGDESLTSNPLFANRAKATDQEADACNALLAPWFLMRTKDQLLNMCLENRIPSAPVYDIGEVLRHPQLNERGYFALADTARGTLAVPTHPFRGIGKTAVTPRRVPALGEHDGDVFVAPRQPRGPLPGAEPLRPLAGIRVVDFGWVWAGAIPGHILADLGAEVIRVESRKPLDFMRQGRPLVGTEKDPEQNPIFQNVNRGKLGLCIDMAKPGATEIMWDLIGKSDVVIDNFAPGVMRKFGLDGGDLRKRHPSLITCSLSAAGQTGPLHGIRTYAVMIGALSGLNSAVGYPDGPVIAVQSPPYADPNAGIHAAFGILAALMGRQSTGEGASIDLSQWEAAVNLMGEQLMDCASNGRVAQPCGNHQALHAPYGHYPVRGTDRWIAISVSSDEQWRALSAILGDPEWTSKTEYAMACRRLAKRQRLDELLARETARHDGNQLAERLCAVGVPAAPLHDLSEILGHPYFKARGLFEMVAHPILKQVPVYRLPWHRNGQPIPITRRAPCIGEHSDYVLHTLLGKGPREIAALRADSVIA